MDIWNYLDSFFALHSLISKVYCFKILNIHFSLLTSLNYEHAQNKYLTTWSSHRCKISAAMVSPRYSKVSLVAFVWNRKTLWSTASWKCRAVFWCWQMLAQTWWNVSKCFYWKHTIRCFYFFLVFLFLRRFSDIILHCAWFTAVA